MADQFDPKAWTRAHEGFSDEVYLDQRGLPTAGVGHLITETSPYFGAQEGDILSTKHLEEQYDKDYASHAKLASSNFKNFDKHPQHVKDALINMTFQLGNKPKKWKNFQAALDEGLKSGNYQNAAYHGADSKWFRDQTPKRARSVLDRLAYGSDYNYTRPDALADLPDYTSPRQAAKATPAAQLAAPAPPPVAEDPSWWDRVKAVAGFADGTYYDIYGQQVSGDNPDRKSYETPSWGELDRHRQEQAAPPKQDDVEKTIGRSQLLRELIFSGVDPKEIPAMLKAKGYADGETDARKALEIGLEALGTGAGELVFPGGGGLAGRAIGSAAADTVGDAAYNFGHEYGPAIAGTGKEIGSWFGLADGALTNPEAGPSDTVPAMLTPGEAVIPASVAMDPEFKPVIKEMVDEGRERNRSAESLGIPVNHAAAARPPGEQQGYMGGVPHVDGFADGIGGAFDKLLPESVKARWQEAKDTKTGVEDAYSAYKWLDEKDAQLRDMSGGYLGIPTWQDPINWELVGEYGDEALKGARTYGKYKRKAGEVLDAIGLADGAESQKTINIPGYGEIPEYLAYSVPGLGPYLNTKNALEAGLSGDWKEAAKQGGFAASNFIPIPQSLQKLAGTGLQTAGKFVGLQGGTDMIPKPMGAPPKYNIDRPDHGEFNVASDQMGEGMKMDLTNAKHRQQVANKEGDHAQKMQHEKEAAAQKMQLDQMKAEQKLMNDQQAEGMKLQMKVADSDVDGLLTQQKQAALDTSINGMGFFEDTGAPAPPMGLEPPGGLPGLFDGSAVVGQNQIAGYADGRPSVVNGEYRGYADGDIDVATKAAMIRRFQDKFGLKGEDLKHVINNEVDTLQQVREIQAAEAAAAARAAQAVVPPVAQPTPPPQQAPAPDPNSTHSLYGAGPSGAARHLFNELQGRADGGMIGDRDIIVDGEFMSSHVPDIQGLANGGSEVGNLDQSSVSDISSLLSPSAKPAIPGAFGLTEAFDPFMSGFKRDQAAARESTLAGVPQMQGPEKPLGWDEDQARMAANERVQEQGRLEAAEQARMAQQQAAEGNRQVIEEADKVIDDPRASSFEKVQALGESQQAARANIDNEKQATDAAAEVLGITESQQVQGEGQTQSNSENAAAINAEGNDATSNSTPESLSAADKAPPEQKSRWLSAVGDVFKTAFGDLADPNSLATAAIVYGANQLLGYDSATSAEQALSFYKKGIQGKQASEAAAAKRQMDLQDHATKEKQSADANIYQKRQEALIGDPAAQQKEARSYFTGVADDALKKGGIATNPETGERLIDATSKGLAAEQAQWMKENGINDVQNADAVLAYQEAIRRAGEQGRFNPKQKPRSIKPFLQSAFMDKPTGLGRGAFGKYDEKSGEYRPLPIKRTQEMRQRLKTQGVGAGIKGNSDQTVNKRLAALGQAFKLLEQKDPKLLKQLQLDATKTDNDTAFSLFVMHRLKNMKS